LIHAYACRIWRLFSLDVNRQKGGGFISLVISSFTIDSNEYQHNQQNTDSRRRKNRKINRFGQSSLNLRRRFHNFHCGGSSLSFSLSISLSLLVFIVSFRSSCCVSTITTTGCNKEFQIKSDNTTFITAGNTCSRPDEKGMGQNFEVLKPERHP